LIEIYSRHRAVLSAIARHLFVTFLQLYATGCTLFCAVVGRQTGAIKTLL